MPCVLQPVIVNVVSDPSTALKGVLWSARGGWLTLRGVSYLKAGVPPTQMDGEIVIHRDNVAFIQVVPS